MSGVGEWYDVRVGGMVQCDGNLLINLIMRSCVFSCS